MKEKIKKIYFRLFGPLKARKFNFTDFTIISNNCFGGIVYRNHHLPYLTPTAGMFIMPKDYIKFIYNLEYYLSIIPLEIQLEQSSYFDYLKSINYTGVIGKIDDVELMFLHYDDFNEARTKWERRKKRVNFDKIIYKFNDQNNCTIEELKEFEAFPAKNKILFTGKQYEGIDSFVLKQFKNIGYVVDDTKKKNTRKVFNIYKFINNMIDGNYT